MPFKDRSHFRKLKTLPVIPLSRSLSKDQLRELWEALRKNDVHGLQKFEEFLTKVSGELRRAKMDSEQLESALKRYANY